MTVRVSTTGRRFPAIRFGLRTLLLAVAVLNIVCAVWVAYHRRMVAAREARALASFDHQRSSAVALAVDSQGREFSVVTADHEQLAAIADLPTVGYLRLSGATDDDLSLVAQFSQLRGLDLVSAGVTSVGLSRLSALHELTALAIQADNFTAADFDAIADLKNLEELTLIDGLTMDELLNALRRIRPALRITSIPAPSPGTIRAESSAGGALRWIANQQAANGSWHFAGQSSAETDDIEATALALLPFLAAGQTERSPGPFQKTVYRGLYYLTLINAKRPAMLLDNSLTTQALATMVLSEAAMRDGVVKKAAGSLVGNIIAKQNQVLGGWSQSGAGTPDVVTTCWQLQALASAKGAGLDVLRETILRARAYIESQRSLDSHQVDSAPSTSTLAWALSVQLLSWPADYEEIVSRYRKLMARAGPSQQDPSWNLLAHMLVFQGGQDADWDQWRRCQRYQSVLTQVRYGSETGSWFAAAKLPSGGRLQTTALNCLPLLTYYRLLPRYNARPPHGSLSLPDDPQLPLPPHW